MLLCATKHLRPDIANPVRELSKVLDFPTMAAYKEMLRVMTNVMATRNKGLRLQPKKNPSRIWEIVAYSDSDYAGDPDSCRSVGGYILFVMGVPVAWRSKAQKSVTLSSTEAEWYALSEAVKEVIFVVMLLEDMRVMVEFPVEVRVDNIGTIWMTNNVSTTGRTKHVDVRTKFVREFQDDGVIKVEFVSSEDNTSDIMTKNVQAPLFDKHSDTLVCDKLW